MKILVACEYSGVVRDAFTARGHDAWSCDLLPCKHPGQHVVGDVRHLLSIKWDMIIAHPPCTYLTKARGLVDLPRLKQSADFFNIFTQVECPRVCIENPMPFRIAYNYIPRPNHWVCPTMFGSAKKKFTCLWLKGLPPLMPTVYYPRSNAKSVVYSTKGSKYRSKTMPELAMAMAEQWG